MNHFYECLFRVQGYGHFCFAINSTLGRVGLKSLFPALDFYVALGEDINCVWVLKPKSV